jgi:ATP-binding cassette subfamily B protein
LLLAASELDIKADVVALAKAAKTTSEGTSLEGLVAAAKSIGLKAEGVQVDRDALAQLSTPLIAWWEGNHFVVVLEIKENVLTGEVTARVHDPNKPKPESVKLADLLAKSGGIVLTLKKQ